MKTEEQWDQLSNYLKSVLDINSELRAILKMVHGEIIGGYGYELNPDTEELILNYFKDDDE